MVAIPNLWIQPAAGRRTSSGYQPLAAPPLPCRSSRGPSSPTSPSEGSYPSTKLQHAGPAISHGGEAPWRRRPRDPAYSTARPEASPAGSHPARPARSQLPPEANHSEQSTAWPIVAADSTPRPAPAYTCSVRKVPPNPPIPLSLSPPAIPSHRASCVHSPPPSAASSPSHRSPLPCRRLPRLRPVHATRRPPPRQHLVSIDPGESTPSNRRSDAQGRTLAARDLESRCAAAWISHLNYGIQDQRWMDASMEDSGGNVDWPLSVQQLAHDLRLTPVKPALFCSDVDISAPALLLLGLGHLGSSSPSSYRIFW